MTIIAQDKKKLEDTHPDYDSMLKRWQLWGAAYDGEDEFIAMVLKQNARESTKNFEQRLADGEVFNYSATIVDLFCHFLSQQQVHRVLGKLSDDKQWQMFQNDVDLYGTDYDVFWSNLETLASVYGFTGVLVDKPNSATLATTRNDEIKASIYPYFSVYIPENIPDWEYQRNSITARPELVYLKLKEENGYLVWTKDEWERWTLKDGSESEYELKDGNSGENNLKEIPFVWHTNYSNLKKPYLGVSDIKGVSRIQAAITRDLSNGSEIIKYAAFPMMRKPMLTSANKPGQGDDLAGVTAVLEFDPEQPNSKPDWLEAKVKEPIDSILAWMERKVLEIYRGAHLSNVHGSATSGSAKSGVALRYEFQQLTSVLTAKGNDLDEAELKAISYWLKWQNELTWIEGIEVNRPSSFNIDDLAIQLENCLIATTIVRSESFKKALQKKVARLTLPDEPEDTMNAIDEEIDALKEEESEPVVPPVVPGEDEE